MTTPVSSFPRSTKLNRRLSRLLSIGMLISLFFIIWGMFLLLVRGGEVGNQVIPLGRLPGELFSLQPEAFLNLGILVLLAVPISVVISLVLFFWMEKERVYILVSAAVVCVLLLSILIAQRLLF